ncbi:hypothetical protein PQO03_15855 [Lentisphaera profundi]|uniref:Uncharacterized protein n=1 Tax=Lentisphaera profundi TaxID=1658616 RepID=A0ABY7W2T8_9BACT|nr:hypothetical protein [Lentisphaera profundi]WDE99311.1 hypothetical protein PQO03_15855 [Lentisphaera profundi]
MKYFLIVLFSLSLLSATELLKDPEFKKPDLFWYTQGNKEYNHIKPSFMGQRWTTRPGTYSYFIPWQYGTRTYSENYAFIPENAGGDSAVGLGELKRHPILTDPVMNQSAWFAEWDNSTTQIHKKTGYKIPVLMDDHSVCMGNGAPWLDENKLQS